LSRTSARSARRHGSHFVRHRPAAPVGHLPVARRHVGEAAAGPLGLPGADTIQVDATTVLLKWGDLPALANGAEESYSAGPDHTVTIPTTVPFGTYYLWFYVDHTRVVSESTRGATTTTAADRSKWCRRPIGLLPCKRRAGPD